MEECVNVATDERVHFRKLLSARYDSHFKDRVWSDIQLYHINAPQKKAVGIEFAKHFRSHLDPKHVSMAEMWVQFQNPPLESLSNEGVYIAARAVSADGLLCCTISNDRSVKIYDVVNYDMMVMIGLSFVPEGGCESVSYHITLGSPVTRLIDHSRKSQKKLFSGQPPTLPELLTEIPKPNFMFRRGNEGSHSTFKQIEGNPRNSRASAVRARLSPEKALDQARKRMR